MRKKAFILSPFATVPLDAGQRKRANQTTQIFKDMGFEITFLLYAFEDGWKSHASEEWLQEMRNQWGEVIVLHANSKVGLPARSGWTHTIDEWWDDILETHLKEVFAYRFYDVFVVHNVWLSKAFELAPLGTVRILDAHDVFSTRLAYFEKTNRTPEFFITDAKSEALAVSRADIVLGIQEVDTEWFARHTQAFSLCLPYCPSLKAEPCRPARNDYLHKDKVVFGFLGSGHVFNATGLSAYCSELASLVGRNAAPVELHIGGEVCQAIAGRGPWILHGKVDDEDKFFDQVDVMVAPVFDGSGFKVKMADASARGMPIIAASHATIGMNFEASVIAENPNELAGMTANIAMHRPHYRHLQDISRRACLDLKTREARGVQKLSRKIGSWRGAILYDATGLSLEEASCVLLSWSGAFHLMRFLAKQLVVAPEALREALERHAPAGVIFVSEDEVRTHVRQIWRWITVKNINPVNWGAAAEHIWIDREWHNVLADADANHGVSSFKDSDTALFWHNITWDLMVQVLIKRSIGVIETRNEKRNPSIAETVLVADRQCRGALAGPIAALFSECEVTGLNSFDEFFDLMIRVTSGRIRRLIMAERGHPARAHVLRELCGIRGIDYVGLTGQGGLSSGKAPDMAVKRTYDRFEQQWRIQKHDGEVPEPLGPEKQEQKQRQPKSTLKLLSTPFVDQVRFSAVGKTVPKNNLHYLEHDSHGTPFRWTGPNEACNFSFFLERRTHLLLEFVFLDFRDAIRQTPLTMYVDGVCVAPRITRPPPRGFVASAILPPWPETAQCATEVVFAVKEVIRASVDDDRLLGVAFSELRISPVVETELDAAAPFIHVEGEPAVI